MCESNADNRSRAELNAEDTKDVTGGIVRIKEHYGETGQREDACGIPAMQVFRNESSIIKNVELNKIVASNETAKCGQRNHVVLEVGD